MKTTILSLILILLAGCASIQPSAWIMGGSDMQQDDNVYVGRAGAKIDSTEIGAQVQWQDIPGRESAAEQLYSAYIITEVLPDPNGLTPYMGFVGDFGKHSNSFDGFIAGTALPIHQDDNSAIDSVIEYQHVNYQDERDKEDIAMIGLRWRFY